MNDEQERSELIIKILDSLLDFLPVQEKQELISTIKKYSDLLISIYPDKEVDKYFTFYSMMRYVLKDPEKKELIAKIEKHIDPDTWHQYILNQEREKVILKLIKHADSAPLLEYLADHSKPITPDLRNIIREYIVRLNKVGAELGKELKKLDKRKEKNPALNHPPEFYRIFLKVNETLLQQATHEPNDDLKTKKTRDRVWNNLKTKLPDEFVKNPPIERGEITEAAKRLTEQAFGITKYQLDERLRKSRRLKNKPEIKNSKRQ